MATIARAAREAVSERRGNRPDWILFATMVVLAIFGLVMIYSATRSSGTFSMERQMIFVAAGIVLYLVASMIDYREYRALIPYIYGGIIVLLIAVFFFPERNGAQRWIELGLFDLQPAEVAKIVVVLGIASILSPQNRDELRPDLTWPKIGLVILTVGVPAGLIYQQPDLGTMLVFVFVMMAMLFAAGASWRQLLTLVGAGTAVTVALYRMGAIAEYQLNRIRVLVDPTVDPQGIGYNLAQSKLAIGSGQLLGRGLFKGTQTNFQYVPEQETDFIFTAVAEQLGFVGGVVVLLAYMILIWRILVIAANARDRFGALVAIGVAATFMFHIFINIGMTMGITPVTGLPLPFLSLGGSAFMSLAFALGIVNSIWLRRSPVPGEQYVM
ncbi:MAG: rod shape-determining protein RodA [Actinomycetes bacterium]|jgi:rod shape determining protein RodA|nr:rod shape-determining protein RodA [Acidimicrobiia bacterium]